MESQRGRKTRRAGQSWQAGLRRARGSVPPDAPSGGAEERSPPGLPGERGRRRQLRAGDGRLSGRAPGRESANFLQLLHPPRRLPSSCSPRCLPGGAPGAVGGGAARISPRLQSACEAGGAGEQRGRSSRQSPARNTGESFEGRRSWQAGEEERRAGLSCLAPAGAAPRSLLPSGWLGRCSAAGGAPGRRFKKK